jgi:hypothetical protein
MQFSSLAFKILGGCGSCSALEGCANSPFSSCRSEVEVLGEILYSDIQIGKTNTLGMPWDIVKDKEDLECQTSSHNDTVFKLAFTGVAFCLTTAPQTDKYFGVSSSSHTSKASSGFSKKGSVITYTRNFCTSLIFIFLEAKDHHSVVQ